jgi:hypothetical protein
LIRSDLTSWALASAPVAEPEPAGSPKEPSVPDLL